MSTFVQVCIGISIIWAAVNFVLAFIGKANLGEIGGVLWLILATLLWKLP